MSIQENDTDHMLQTVDRNDVTERQQWLQILARAPELMLAEGLSAVPQQSRTWLRTPETGLYMVQARVGGTGNRFNVGEISVTRCALCISSGTCGVAYVQGRSHRRAEMAAMADALLQVDQYKSLLQTTLIQPISEYLNTKSRSMQEKAQSTRVDFFTVAREAGASESEEGES